MKTNRITIVNKLLVAIACVVSVPLLWGGSLSVPEGQTRTIESDATYDSIDVAGTLIVNGATVTSASALSLSGGTVQLGAGGKLSVAGVAASGDATVTFDGGQLVSSAAVSATGCTLTLAGGSGDVDVSFANSSWTYIFLTPSSGKIVVSGAKDFVLRVPSVGGGIDTSSLKQQQTGRMVLRSGTLSVFKDVFGASVNLMISGGATLDVGGCWITVGSLTGGGTLTGTSGANSGQVTLSVASGTTARCVACVLNVRMIKKGAGVLEVLGTTPTDFQVQAGTIRTLLRSAVGYSQYRLKVDDATKRGLTGMQLNELAFYNGANDVTADYAQTSFDSSAGYNGGKIFDKNDTTKWWYTYDDTANPSFDKAWVEVVYPEHRVITGYKLKSQDWGGDVPSAWRLYGRDAGGEWELLDERSGQTIEPNYQWSSEYAVSCATHPGRLNCPSVALASGTTLAAVEGTVLTCTSLTDSGATYDFDSGAMVSLGTATDMTIQGGVGGAFVKTGSGALVSYGVTTLSALRVADGSLALRTPVALKQWRLAIGNVYDLSGGEVTFGELAVYDASGNRLNVTGTATMASYSGESFAPGQAGNLYDNNGGTQGWMESKGLDPNNEATWKTTSFTLSDSAPAVVSYNLMTASYIANGRPKTWKLYARASADDEWTLVDAQTDVSTPSTSYTWYHGGVPWHVASTVGSASAFAAATPVTVDPGATLDVTCAAETLIGRLVVDGDAVGTGVISGGSFAANGTLSVTFAGADSKPPFDLPISCADVADAVNLKTWTVTRNGRPINARLVRLANGQLRVEPIGLILVVW